MKGDVTMSGELGRDDCRLMSFLLEAFLSIFDVDVDAEPDPGRSIVLLTKLLAIIVGKPVDSNPAAGCLCSSPSNCEPDEELTLPTRCL